MFFFEGVSLGFVLLQRPISLQTLHAKTRLRVASNTSNTSHASNRTDHLQMVSGIGDSQAGLCLLDVS